MDSAGRPVTDVKKLKRYLPAPSCMHSAAQHSTAGSVAPRLQAAAQPGVGAAGQGAQEETARHLGGAGGPGSKVQVSGLG
jgi:hypothetical protein